MTTKDDQTPPDPTFTPTTEAAPPPEAATTDPLLEDETMTDRINENGKALVWALYQASAARHIHLQRTDRNARRMALILNPPAYADELDACTRLAGGIFAERAACIEVIRSLQATVISDKGPETETSLLRGVLDEAIRLLRARGPAMVAAEWATEDEPPLSVAG